MKSDKKGKSMAVKTVLVTGAGGGLGRAICERFHKEGYHIIATDYALAALDHLKGVERYSRYKLDVTKKADAKKVAAAIAKEFGQIDVIVNNAGIIGYFPIVEADPDMTINAFMINTFGPLIVTQACLDLLIKAKGRVINISSESSVQPMAFQFYPSTKGALESLSQAIRQELRLFDCHVAYIRPGAIATDLFATVHDMKNQVENSRFQTYFENFASAVKKRAPKPNQPEEVAAVIYKAAIDPKKKVMYKINNSLSVKIFTRLPDKWFDAVMATTMKGKQK